MERKNLLLILFLILPLSLSLPSYSQQPPSFVIFAYGFWGSMDKLPSTDPDWLAESPYPHIQKHQTASFLAGPKYRPIPQSMLATGEGPLFTKYFLCSYYLLEHELSYWAGVINKKAHRERIRIFDDWQTLQVKKGGQYENSIGEVNIIYLKYDWRLDLPQVERDYVQPLISFIDERWPDAQIHWVGHSLGGLLGRYAVSKHPRRFTSLISIGGPNYGIYEIGMQCRGERVTFNGRWDLEQSQEFGLSMAERFFFGTRNVKTGRGYYVSAANFIKQYLPMMKWMDPQAGLLKDGFGDLAKLREAVPHAIAMYGLGFGSYDLQGDYHPEIPDSYGIGPGLEPNGDSPPDYGVTGDGRVDPVSAIGPFTGKLCLGKDRSHGSLMWSPLVLAFLVDRYLYNGEMTMKSLWLEMKRLDVPYNQRKQRIKWIIKARKVWTEGNG